MTKNFITKEKVLADMNYERGVIEYSNKIAEILTDGNDVAPIAIDKFIDYVNSIDGDSIEITDEEMTAHNEQVTSYVNRKVMLDEILSVINKYK